MYTRAVMSSVRRQAAIRTCRQACRQADRFTWGRCSHAATQAVVHADRRSGRLTCTIWGGVVGGWVAVYDPCFGVGNGSTFGVGNGSMPIRKRPNFRGRIPTPFSGSESDPLSQPPIYFTREMPPRGSPATPTPVPHQGRFPTLEVGTFLVASGCCFPYPGQAAARIQACAFPTRPRAENSASLFVLHRWVLGRLCRRAEAVHDCFAVAGF